MFDVYVICIIRKKLTEIMHDMSKPSKIYVPNKINKYIGQQMFAIVAYRVHNMMSLQWIMLATLPNFLRLTIINNWYTRLEYRSRNPGGTVLLLILM